MLVLALAIAGCTADRPVTDAVRPVAAGSDRTRVDHSAATESTVTTATDRGHAPTTVTTPVTTTPRTTRDPGTDPPDAATAAPPALEALLVDYDRTLTLLSADPAAAADVNSALRQRWLSVVAAGSLLAGDLPDGVLRLQRDRNEVVRPPAGALSYVHHAVRTVPAADGSLSFTWCGWSPGIGFDLTTGAILDDGVAHSHGTGRAVSTPSGWRLVVLEMTDSTILPAGSPDPCPTEPAPG